MKLIICSLIMITVVFSTEGFSSAKAKENSSLEFSCSDNKSICDLKKILESNKEQQNVGELFTISFKYLDTKKLFDKSIRDFKAKLNNQEYQSLYHVFDQLIENKMKEMASSKRGQYISNLTIKNISSEEKTHWLRLQGDIKNKKNIIDLEITNNLAQFEIQDLTINTVSLSRTYQGQFNKIFRIEGYQGLHDRIQKRITKS